MRLDPKPGQREIQVAIDRNVEIGVGRRIEVEVRPHDGHRVRLDEVARPTERCGDALPSAAGHQGQLSGIQRHGPFDVTAVVRRPATQSGPNIVVGSRVKHTRLQRISAAEAQIPLVAQCRQRRVQIDL